MYVNHNPSISDSNSYRLDIKVHKPRYASNNRLFIESVLLFCNITRGGISSNYFQDDSMFHWIIFPCCSILNLGNDAINLVFNVIGVGVIRLTPSASEVLQRLLHANIVIYRNIS